jgi:hypothetical protein
VALVGAWRIGTPLPAALLAGLCENRKYRGQYQSNRKNESSFHFYLLDQVENSPHTTQVNGNWAGPGPATLTYPECQAGTTVGILKRKPERENPKWKSNFERVELTGYRPEESVCLRTVEFRTLRKRST